MFSPLFAHVITDNALARPDLSSPIEERPIGGLGLHSVRDPASGLEHKNTGGRNRLTIYLRRDKE